MSNIWREILERALVLMDFKQIYQLWKEYSGDACQTEYAFGCPYYVTHKESEEVSDFIWEYLEKYHSKELNEWTDARADEADEIWDSVRIKNSLPEKICCDYCKKEKPYFTLNCCEECFDEETDKYYDEDK